MISLVSLSVRQASAAQLWDQQSLLDAGCVQTLQVAEQRFEPLIP